MIHSSSPNTVVKERPLTRFWQHRWFRLFSTLGLLVGLLAGWVLHRRWAMVLAVAVYIVAVELARLDAVGPTVDAIVWTIRLVFWLSFWGGGFMAWSGFYHDPRCGNRCAGDQAAAFWLRYFEPVRHSLLRVPEF